MLVLLPVRCSWINQQNVILGKRHVTLSTWSHLLLYCVILKHGQAICSSTYCSVLLHVHQNYSPTWWQFFLLVMCIWILALTHWTVVFCCHLILSSIKMTCLHGRSVPTPLSHNSCGDRITAMTKHCNLPLDPHAKPKGVLGGH